MQGNTIVQNPNPIAKSLWSGIDPARLRLRSNATDPAVFLLQNLRMGGIGVEDCRLPGDAQHS
jgi:hypothetical protein